ncbi:HAD family hydrolase [Palleronia sp. LCG004]|uniref:sulfotransferase-like domain-containing protein n=1 Tax=Palleronia sp. LCG004 TaxID=3079304 RepID=UPI0029425C0D|nr:HAD family hydrolase [Palleronia sp. LCG004]WOI55530.1 HAD family hydrolase [Palleronia sp. LCG004]
MRVIGWSGPRNLSTAMMYAFGARPDCAVSDEPFYAAYLAATGVEHPMGDAVLGAQPTDPARVARECSGQAPGGRTYWYQKHMCQHMLDDFPLDWAEGARHVFLIRHPARVVASYAQKRGLPTLDDLGYVRQAALHARFGGPVVDSTTIRADPAAALGALCDAIDMPFDPAMLTWPAGGHPSDGIWAAHWYDAVHRSTGFAEPEGPLPVLDGSAGQLVADAMPYYEALLSVALR